MSTVVVVKKHGVAAIAADTLTSYGSMKLSAAYNRWPSKIVRAGDSFVGVVGCSAHKLVLEHLFDSLNAMPVLSSRQDVFELFRSIHPRLKESYFLNARDDDSDPYDSNRMTLLIANRYGIFGVYSLREAFEYERFWASGSGSEYALGAMHALYEGGMDAREIAEAAVAAAIDFDDATGGPVISEVIELARPACEREKEVVSA